jgi:hypothetical protein
VYVKKISFTIITSILQIHMKIDVLSMEDFCFYFEHDLFFDKLIEDMDPYVVGVTLTIFPSSVDRTIGIKVRLAPNH